MPVRVYYEDTDFTGIVYHANYLRFMERGRSNYLRLLGANQRGLLDQAEREAPGFAFVVRSMQIEFLKSARMDEVIDVVDGIRGDQGRLDHAPGQEVQARRRSPRLGACAGGVRVRWPRPADPETVAGRHADRKIGSRESGRLKRTNLSLRSQSTCRPELM